MENPSLQLTRERLLDLDQIANIAAGAMSIGEVYDAIDLIVGRLIPNDGLILNLLEPDRTLFRVVLRTGITPQNRAPGEAYDVSGTVFEALVTSETPVRVTARTIGEATSKYLGLEGAFRAGYRSWLGVSLFSHGVAIGGLHIQRTRPDPFSDFDVDLLRRVAIHVGATSGKHEVLKQREADRVRDQVLVEVGKILALTNSVQYAVDQTAVALRAAMPVDRLVVSIWNPTSQSMRDVARWGLDVPGWDEIIDKPSKVLSPAHFDLDRPFMIVSTRTIMEADEEANPALFYGRQAGLVSMLVASMVEDRKRTGNISVRSITEHAYSARDARLFQEIASQFTHYLSARSARISERTAVQQ